MNTFPWGVLHTYQGRHVRDVSLTTQQLVCQSLHQLCTFHFGKSLTWMCVKNATAQRWVFLDASTPHAVVKLWTGRVAVPVLLRKEQELRTS